jgi:hypothetical protein
LSKSEVALALKSGGGVGKLVVQAIPLNIDIEAEEIIGALGLDESANSPGSDGLEICLNVFPLPIDPPIADYVKLVLAWTGEDNRIEGIFIEYGFHDFLIA